MLLRRNLFTEGLSPEAARWRGQVDPGRRDLYLAKETSVREQSPSARPPSSELIVKRPAPKDYGFTEQEAEDLRAELETRAFSIGGRIAVAGTAAFCIYSAVTEGLLIAILVTISAGLFFLL
jgi:hypothetical protein